MNPTEKIKNLNLNTTEIEEILDSVCVTDEIVDLVAYKYSSNLDDPLFQRVKNIINILDLTKADEDVISKSLTDAAKRSFCKLMINGKLSRSEVIYFIKNKLITDNDLVTVFNSCISKDLADIVLQWKPNLFETVLLKYCEKYKITQQMIDDVKHKQQQLEKFKFINNE